MTITTEMLLLILGCAIVTWIPRILPFIFVRSLTLPNVVLRWLGYIPVCILSALVFESLLDTSGAIVSVDWHKLITFVPTLAIALLTKSLSLTVIGGVIIMALVRFFM